MEKRNHADNNATTFGSLALGFGIGTAVLIATTVTLFVLDSRKRRAHETSIITVSPVGIQGRF